MKIIFEFEEEDKLFHSMYYKTEWNYCVIPRIGEKIFGSALFSNLPDKELLNLKNYLHLEFEKKYSEYNEFVIKMDIDCMGKRTVSEETVFKKWLFENFYAEEFKITEVTYIYMDEIIAVLTVALLI